MTFRSIEVPDIVPLYSDFHTLIGVARLRRKESKIYAIIEPTWKTNEINENSLILLGWDNSTRNVEDGVCYVDGGSVTCASLISQEYINKFQKRNTE